MKPSIHHSPNLTAYFVIDRRTGTSYDIDRQGNLSASGLPNKAGQRRANFSVTRLAAAIAQRRYRLVAKTQPYSALYKGDYQNRDPRDPDIYWQRKNVLP